MKPANPRVLTINGGSSSIKFALFEAGDSLRRINRDAGANQELSSSAGRSGETKRTRLGSGTPVRGANPRRNGSPTH